MKNRGSVLQRCLYGCADIYGGGVFVIITTFFSVFMTKVVGMPAVWAGTIPFIGKVWDAITDPLMGNIVDRTKSKWGTKRLYLFIGALLSGVTFVFLWINITSGTMLAKYVYYVAMYIIFSTGYTIVMVPYNALLPDMVDDYVLRARYSGVRMIFSAIGAILAGLLPSLLISDNRDGRGYLTSAVLFSSIAIVAILLTFFGTSEKPKEPVRVSFGESLTQSLTVFKSRTFRLFVIIFLISQVTADFVTGMAVYFVDDGINAYTGNNFIMLMVVILASQLVGTLVFDIVMSKTEKRVPIVAGTVCRVIASIVAVLVCHEGMNFNLVLVIGFFLGFGSIGSTVSIYAILSDMSDVDELITSISRPGTCSGMATFVRKIASGLCSALIGIILFVVGFDETIPAGAVQAYATQRGIVIAFGIVPTVLMLVCMVCVVRFPINKKEFDIVKLEVARRKGEDDSIATPEEIAVCESVTGFKFDRLWDKNNAFRMRNDGREKL